MLVLLLRYLERDQVNQRGALKDALRRRTFVIWDQQAPKNLISIVHLYLGFSLLKIDKDIRNDTTNNDRYNDIISPTIFDNCHI